ncbi:MAG: hypothetical protein Q8N30_11570 [Methylococcales bacterium]|nr:hypothetical protein [Methylococcales bacterium]
MKKNKLPSIVLLCVSVGCIANMSVVSATETAPQKKAVTKNATVQKKIKPVPNRKITERDITECTRILSKATKLENDRLSQKEMLAIAATNNTKISQHLKKPADVQLFASDDPAAIAHLTGKTTVPPPAPVLKHTAKATKITPIASTSAKPIAKSTAHSTPKTDPKVFSADAPKAVASNSKSATAKLTANNPAVTKTTTPPAQATRSQPHIELFAPNTAADLDHLEGRYASLEVIQKPTSADKSATAHSKTKAKKQL